VLLHSGEWLSICSGEPNYFKDLGFGGIVIGSCEVEAVQEGTDSEHISDLSGHSIGRFDVLSRLGRGGMGEVYLAEDTKLKRKVALKRLAPRLQADQRFRRRFLHEAERVSSLSNHPNIAALYDIVEHSGELFLVMEYVEGTSLRERMGAPFSPRDFLPIAFQVLQGLKAAHEQQIVHRDIKPENILLSSSGDVKVCDFGLARRLNPEDGSTKISEDFFLGTVAYTAPEVLMGKPPTLQSDFFSLGVVFWEMLSGRPLFWSETFMQAADRVIHNEAKRIRAINADVSERLEKTVLKMLRKEPSERYANVDEILAELKNTEANTADWASRLRPLAAAIVATLVLATSWIGYKNFEAGRDAPAEAGTHRMLIADFDNRTGDPFFDKTVSELLTIGLGQSRSLNVFPRARVIESLQRMQRMPMPDKIDPATAKVVCLKENLDTLISGDIVVSGKGYQIVIRAVDPRTDAARKLITQTVANKDDLTKSMDTISTVLRTGLGEQPALVAATSKPLSQATTRSTLALTRFFEALDLHRSTKLTEARALLENVVQLDPDFAMARDHLASLYRTEGDWERGLAEITRAYELRDRVTEREGYLISGEYHFQMTDYEESVEDYRRATLLFPGDSYAHKYLAQSLNKVVRLNEAVTAIRRAAELDPGDANIAEQYVLFLAQANRPEEALTAIQEARIMFPEVHRLASVEGFVWMMKGDFTRARLLWAEFGQGNDSLLTMRVSNAQTYMLEGELSSAIRELEDSRAERRKPTQGLFDTMGLSFLAKLYLQRGLQQEALRIARVLADVRGSPSTLHWLREAGLIFSRAEDRQDAETVLRKIEQVEAEFPSGYSRGISAQIHGEVARIGGNTELARQSFERARASWLDPSTYWSSATFYFDQKDYRQARDLLKAMIGLKGDLLRWHFGLTFPMAHLLIARCERNLGNNAEADKNYMAFLQLWGNSKDMAGFANEVRREQSTLLFKR